MLVCYRSLRRWKYETTKDFSVKLPELAGAPPFTIKNLNPMIAAPNVMTFDGETLTVFAPYAWDGPSGPTLDTNDTMGGSAVHDALYGALRGGFLPEHWRNAADRALYRICREHGMGELRARAWFYGVAWFARYAAKPSPGEGRDVTHCVGYEEST